MNNNNNTCNVDWYNVNIDTYNVPNNKRGEIMDVTKYVDITSLDRIIKEINKQIPKIKFNCKLQPTIDKQDNVLKLPVPFTIDDEVCFLSVDKKRVRQACAWAFDAEDQLEDPQLDSRIYYEHLGVYC